MTRLLDADPRLRRLCLIKPAEKGYTRSVLSRFIRKVRENRLINIIEEKVVKLLKHNGSRDVDSIFDASFFGLGYLLHLAIDSATMVPLACTFASANQNEQKHSLNLLQKTKLILKQSEAKLRSVIADSQYSDSKLRDAVGAAVIPFRSNQRRDVESLLRVDRKFRTYGPQDQKKEYHKRPHAEAVYGLPEDTVQLNRQ
jgi:hypothetical protein